MRSIPSAALAGAAAILALGCASSMAGAADHAPTDYTLKANQTFGFGNDRLLVFTYDENFDCVDQPHDDLNYNGTPAERDPGELQTPICQAGMQSTIDPTGIPVSRSEPLYVLVPMFSLNDDTNPNDAFTPALGATLIKLFGAVPEAFKTHPLVDVQCPDPGSPPGSCTMHGERIDLFPLLAALHKVPATPKQNIFVPLPDHDHIVNNDAINTKPIWWQVIPVLVTSPSEWPNAQGTSGITSKARLIEAERDGEAIQTPSNFFLFFASRSLGKLARRESAH
jgi:hypothetical protein